MAQETIGKYTLVSKIADGGMAEVYLAQVGGHGGFAKRVAVKKILPYFTKDDAFVHSFINEARICGQLSHINLVEVYEFSQAEDIYYLAMEFIDGFDLERILDHLRETKRPIPVEVASSLILQILDGLDYAHSAKNMDGTPLNVIHRDLKPSNILIDRSGVIKIVDFGIAKASSNLYKTRDLGSAKGTVGYMSPEQAIGSGDLTPSSDLFSIGIIFYELLTLRRLFDGKNVFAILEAVRTADVEARLKEVKVISPELRRVMAKAMARTPEERYATAGEMARDLKAITPQGRGHSQLARYLAGLYRQGLAPLYTQGQRKDPKENAATRTHQVGAKTGDIEGGGSFNALIPELGNLDSIDDEKTLPLPALLGKRGAVNLNSPPEGGGDPLATYVPSARDMPKGGHTTDEPTATETDPGPSIPPPPGPKRDDKTLLLGSMVKVGEDGGQDVTLPDHPPPPSIFPLQAETLPAQPLEMAPSAWPSLSNSSDDATLPLASLTTTAPGPDKAGEPRHVSLMHASPKSAEALGRPDTAYADKDKTLPQVPLPKAERPKSTKAPEVPKRAPPREVGTRRGMALLAVVVVICGVVLGVLFSRDVEMPRVKLTINSEPEGAQVYVDKALKLKETPGSIDLEVDGTRTLELSVRKEGYKEDTRPNLLLNEDDGELSLTFQLDPVAKVGAIYIETFPPGAAILVDGEAANAYTPTTVSGIPIGQRLITLRKSGFKDQTFSFNVAEGDQDLARTLER